MRCRLLNLAAAVSLLLAVAISALWVRSHGRRESIASAWQTSTERCVWDVESLYGTLDFTIARGPHTGPPVAPNYEYQDFTYFDFMNPLPRQWLPFPPVGFLHLSTPGYYADIRTLTLAYWLLLLLALPLPAVAIVRHRRRRLRERGNLCPACGYDLRAHSPGDRCPECGAASPRAV